MAEGDQPDRMSRVEFIALMAMLFATIAFTMDAMLPAMGVIGDDLTPEAPNRAQLVITAFVLGMGIGTFLTGPLSDAYGRKPVIVAGAVIYMVASALAGASGSLEVLLIGRFLAGIGAAAPRVVVTAIIRDRFEGREMARVMSFVMLIFMLFPAVAPLIGAGIIALAGWRWIFWSFVAFGGISILWVTLRLSETHPPERRVPFRFANLRAGVSEILSNRQVVMVTAAMAFLFASLFTMLSVVQPIYEQTFDKAEEFPWFFLVTAMISTTSALLNSQIVTRLGMRKVAMTTFMAQSGLTAAALAFFLQADYDTTAALTVFFAWKCCIFYGMGLTAGNLNALAMAPMGHIAGLTASMVGAMGTVGAVVLAIPTGLAFDGTPVPAAIGILIFTTSAWMIVRRLSEPAASAEAA